MAEHLNGQTFYPFLTEHRAVLVDFYRDGCVPCRRVAPLVSQMEAIYRDRVAVARVNVTASPELAERWEVVSTPTLVVYRSGGEVARHRGALKKNELQALMDLAL